MDIINQCLTLAPVPGLSMAFSVMRYIVSSVQQVQASKRQLTTLVETMTQLMVTLNMEFTAGRLLPDNLVEPLQNLHRLVNQISKFIQQQATCSFLKSMYNKEQRIGQIAAYHRQIGTLVVSFQISALLNIQEWQVRSTSARALDQDELMSRLDALERNQSQLMDTLNAQQCNFMAIMASLQRHLQRQSLDARERQFYSSSLHHISVLSGSHVDLESWMITSYDVDFGSLIGAGGFGEVFQGTWNKTTIALKVLKADGVAASSEAIRREIDTWSKIRHPHVLQFLGANVLDERPFIVMPYLQNGNARNYLEKHPECDRLPILHHISLGVVHLHSMNIIHGDLKAMNVLIDDSGKAILCDFGLSRIKADVTSRTATLASSVIAGSRNWMSPERLVGGIARKPSDIYALGMTLYEIYASEIPLGHIDPGEFTQLVAGKNVRPERPYEDEAPQLTDAVWTLAEQCWTKSPIARPNANAICDAISNLLDTAVRPRPLPGPPRLLDLQPPALHNPPTGIPQTPLHYSNSSGVDASLLPLNQMRRSLPPTPSSRVPFLRLIGHTSSVWSVAFSPDGKRIASGSKDKTLRLWNAQTGKEIIRTVPQADIIESVCFSPDGKKIVTPGFQTICVWDADSGQLTATFQQSSMARGVTFSPDGKHIAFGSKDKAIHVIDTLTGKPLHEPFDGHSAAVYSVAFSPDGTRLVSGSADKTLSVWDAVSEWGRLVGPFHGHNKAICSTNFSPDGTLVASGSADNNVIVWDAGTGRLVQEFHGHTGWVICVAFSPDGMCIVSSSRDGTIRIWNAMTGSLIVPPLTWHTKCVNSVAFSPDGERIVSGSYDKTICIGHWRDF